MFLNQLYTIETISSSESDLSAVIRIDPAHILYEGHFPGSPVTPGVVQLQIIKEILEQKLGTKLAMKTMRTCKFLQIINPKETPVVRIDAKFVRSEVLDVTASVRHDENVYLKAQLTYSFN